MGIGGVENAEFCNTDFNEQFQEIEDNLDFGPEFFEGLSTGTKKGTVNRDGKDATEVKEAVESLFS